MFAVGYDIKKINWDDYKVKGFGWKKDKIVTDGYQTP